MEQIYLDARRAAELTGLSERHVQRMVASGSLSAEIIEGNTGWGGISYRIPLEALPVEAQIRYWEEVGHTKTAHSEEFDLGAYRERYGEDGLRALLERQRAVLRLIGMREGGVKDITGAIEALAAECNMSGATLRRLEKRYKEEGLTGLTRNGRSDKGKSRSMCLEARRRIHDLYLGPEKYTAARVLELIAADAQKLGPGICAECPYNPASEAHQELQLTDLASEYPACDQIGGGMVPPPSRHVVNYAIANIEKEVKDYTREGRKKWEDKHMMKCIRAKPDLVNDGWFGDHHQFDVFVLDERGRPVRPWLTAWYDIGSGMLVGWCISLNPNSGTITEALARAIARKKNSPVYGAPKWVYIDNGKDYRSRRFEGDSDAEYWRHRDPEMMNDMYMRLVKASVMQTLRIQVVHAKAYHGWAKPVERFFRTLEEGYCRQLRGYCGGSPANRPENFDRALRHWTERGELMTLDEFVGVFQNQILPAYHAHPHSGYNGETPAARYARLPKARSEIFSWAYLDELRMEQAERVVTTQGIKFDRKIYWDKELMHRVGEHVIIKFSECNMDSITVRGLDAGYICEAELREAMQYVGEDPERVARHVEMQKQQELEVRQRIRALGARVPGKRASGNVYYETVDEGERGNITHMEAERTMARRTERRRRQEAEQWTEADEYYYRLGLAAIEGRKQG